MPTAANRRARVQKHQPDRLGNCAKHRRRVRDEITHGGHFKDRDVGINGPDLLTDFARQGAGLSVGADDDTRIGNRILLEALINDWSYRSIKSSDILVADNSYDLPQIQIFGVGKINSFPDRVLAGKSLIGQ